MKLTRIYVDTFLELHTLVELDIFASHHVQHVLRLEVGDSLIVFDRAGNTYQAQIKAHKKVTHVFINEAMASLPQSPLYVHLIQAISRSEKMDYTLQKSVELGVNRITPLLAERTHMKLANQRWQNKHAHWKKTIISACEQSGRSDVPQLDQPSAFDLYMHSDMFAQYDQKLVLNPYAQSSFKSLALKDCKSVCILIGSEGGFTAKEINQAEKIEFKSIQLGPRILRTETAPLVAITLLQFLYGDLS